MNYCCLKRTLDVFAEQLDPVLITFVWGNLHNLESTLLIFIMFLHNVLVSSIFLSHVSMYSRTYKDINSLNIHNILNHYDKNYNRIYTLLANPNAVQNRSSWYIVLSMSASTPDDHTLNRR